MHEQLENMEPINHGVRQTKNEKIIRLVAQRLLDEKRIDFSLHHRWIPCQMYLWWCVPKSWLAQVRFKHLFAFTNSGICFISVILSCLQASSFTRRESSERSINAPSGRYSGFGQRETKNQGSTTKMNSTDGPLSSLVGEHFLGKNIPRARIDFRVNRKKCL